MDPDSSAPERAMLEQWLDYHRATLAMKCSGVDDDGLRRRAVPPSTMSLLGLVRHMAEVERWWFRSVLNGEDAPPYYYDRTTNPDGDFDDVDAADADADFSTWQAECRHAREVAAGRSLDELGTTARGSVSLRWIYVHMIEEYARHNGHADFLRQVIDGATGS